MSIPTKQKRGAQAVVAALQQSVYTPLKLEQLREILAAVWIRRVGGDFFSLIRKHDHFSTF